MMISLPPDHRVFRTYSHREALHLLCAGELAKNGVALGIADGKYPFYCLILVLGGRGVYEDDRGFRCALHRGMVMQRLPDRRHTLRIEPESGWRESFIGFGKIDIPGIGVERPGDYWKADLLFPRHNRTLNLLDQFSLIDDESPCYALSGEEDLLAGRIRETAEKLKKSPPEYLSRLSGEILGILAQVPLSYARLRERFREETGMSPGQYRIAKRIEEACSLLSVEGFSPGETARKLGYEDTSSFSRQFRKIMGLSPGAYRRG